VLLVVTLAGVFAPAALGLSLPSPHACCARKAPHCHDGAQAEPALSSGGCAQHSCCRSLTIRQWVQVIPQQVTATTISLHSVGKPADFDFLPTPVASAHSGRAPPDRLPA
jgi:hypothetical protein